MSMPAFCAASASSSVSTRSMVSWRLPFMASRSATVGLLSCIDVPPDRLMPPTAIFAAHAASSDFSLTSGCAERRRVGPRALGDQHLGQPDVLAPPHCRARCRLPQPGVRRRQVEQDEGAVAEVAAHRLRALVGKPGDLQGEVVLIRPEPRHRRRRFRRRPACSARRARPGPARCARHSSRTRRPP